MCAKCCIKQEQRREEKRNDSRKNGHNGRVMFESGRDEADRRVYSVQYIRIPAVIV